MAIRANIKPLLKTIGIKKQKLSPQEIMPIIKDAIIIAYHDAIYETPQYSGYLASNLRLGFNSNYGEIATDLYDAHRNWKSLNKDFEVKQKGDDYAIGIAATYNSWFNAVEFTSYTDKVGLKFVGRVAAAYVREVEDGFSLRDINKPGKAMAKAEARMRGRYHATLLRPKVFGTERV